MFRLIHRHNFHSQFDRKRRNIDSEIPFLKVSYGSEFIEIFKNVFFV